MISKVEITQALKKLNRFNLPGELMAELQLYSKMPKHLGVCSTVHRIIERWDGTGDEEKEVCKLLAHILSHHFYPDGSK